VLIGLENNNNNTSNISSNSSNEMTFQEINNNALLFNQSNSLFPLLTKSLLSYYRAKAMERNEK